MNYFLVYSCIVFISAYLDNGLNIQVFSFYHYTFIGYLVLLCAVNLDLTSDISRINNLFTYIIGLQIFATIVKIIVLGRQESYVGTMHITNGSLNTIYPLVAMAFLISMYLFFKSKKIYLLLILSLLLVPYVGEKRAFIFFLPIVLFFMIFLYYVKIQNIKIPIKTILIVTLVSIFIFYLGALTNRTLNVSVSALGAQVGQVDLKLIPNYVISYNIGVSPDGLAVGRLGGLIQSIKYIFSGDIYLLLFGSGPDALINFTSRDGTESQFGILNSGSINGLARYIISIGLLGTISYLAFLLIILKRLFKILKETNIVHSSIVFSITAITIFLLDFFIYSLSMAHSHFFAVWIFLYVGYVIKLDKDNFKS